MGLYFEAYDSSGTNPELGTIMDTVFGAVWNGWTPDVAHVVLEQNIWYSNDAAFVSNIPDFNSNDNFYMRWRGVIKIPADGTYFFKTRSDDGSFLFIDQTEVVNNDGWHGMEDRDGSIHLSAGGHTITIAFNERSGGCGLEVSWRPESGGGYVPLSNEVLAPSLPGMYFPALRVVPL
jgi:hypothetical protein